MLWRGNILCIVRVVGVHVCSGHSLKAPGDGEVGTEGTFVASITEEYIYMPSESRNNAGHCALMATNMPDTRDGNGTGQQYKGCHKNNGATPRVRSGVHSGDRHATPTPTLLVYTRKNGALLCLPKRSSKLSSNCVALWPSCWPSAKLQAQRRSLFSANAEMNLDYILLSQNTYTLCPDEF